MLDPKKYAKKQVCPFCGGSAEGIYATGSCRQGGHGRITQPMICHGCHKEWTDVYGIKTYETEKKNGR